MRGTRSPALGFRYLPTYFQTIYIGLGNFFRDRENEVIQAYPAFQRLRRPIESIGYGVVPVGRWRRSVRTHRLRGGLMSFASYAGLEHPPHSCKRREKDRAPNFGVEILTERLVPEELCR